MSRNKRHKLYDEFDKKHENQRIRLDKYYEQEESIIKALKIENKKLTKECNNFKKELKNLEEKINLKKIFN